MKAAAALLAGALMVPLHAQACDLALSLALDVSASLTPVQQHQIRVGTAAALTNHEVVQSFAGSSVYIEVFEWSSRQQELVAWRQIANADDMADMATAMVNAPKGPLTGGSTAMGEAMTFAHDQFAKLHCDRNVLDIMTDGHPDSVPRIVEARSHFDEGEDEINVLFIGNRAESLAIMNQEVKFGYGGFVQPVPTVEDYEKSMLRKLLREISMNVPPRSEG